MNSEHFSSNTVTLNIICSTLQTLKQRLFSVWSHYEHNIEQLQGW